MCVFFDPLKSRFQLQSAALDARRCGAQRIKKGERAASAMRESTHGQSGTRESAETRE